MRLGLEKPMFLCKNISYLKRNKNLPKLMNYTIRLCMDDKTMIIIYYNIMW